MDDDPEAFIEYLERHGALTDELRARYRPQMPQRPAPLGGLSPTDQAALDAIVASNLATNQALAALALAIAPADGVEPPAPQPGAPRPKNRRYRLTNMPRGEDGELAGDMEYEDGRRRSFRLSRDANGDLEGDIEDLDGVEEAAPAAEADARQEPPATKRESF